MIHPANFVDAHRRHWDDAEFLFHHQRWANADQLYGFSAECGLKAVMKGLGMRVDNVGRPRNSRFVRHVQHIWPEFQAFAHARNGARYLAKLPTGRPFADWSHHNRYASSTPFAHGNVDPHRAAALGICQMVQLATQDGRI